MTGWGSLLATFGILGLLAVSGNAQEIGHSGAGLAMARRLCSQCHAVEKEETESPEADAPAFQQLATTPGMTATALSAALNTSHQAMPSIMLEVDEKADIVAYILSPK
jgi:mono/diheme cytochrome c family protein